MARTYNTIGPICQGNEATLDTALAMASELDWSEYEIEPQGIAYARYQETVNGLDIYYDYGADYYFFVDNTQ